MKPDDSPSTIAKNQAFEFYVGLHNPSDAHRFDNVCVSINRLRRRKSVFAPPKQSWILDSGAFTELSLYGKYRHSPISYIEEAFAWSQKIKNCAAIVSQDYMCEPVILRMTGLTIAQHQRLTIERYDIIKERFDELLRSKGRTGNEPETPCLMPVLQGWSVSDYLNHLAQYGSRIKEGAWVGVGSVCKRQSISPTETIAILQAIKEIRPDLRLHGFGIKLTSLQNNDVRSLLSTADSMAWSFASRIEGRSPNDWREAANFVAKIDGTTIPYPSLPIQSSSSRRHHDPKFERKPNLPHNLF